MAIAKYIYKITLPYVIQIHVPIGLYAQNNDIQSPVRYKLASNR